MCNQTIFKFIEKTHFALEDPIIEQISSRRYGILFQNIVRHENKDVL